MCCNNSALDMNTQRIPAALHTMYSSHTHCLCNPIPSKMLHPCAFWNYCSSNKGGGLLPPLPNPLHNAAGLWHQLEVNTVRWAITIRTSAPLGITKCCQVMMLLMTHVASLRHSWLGGNHDLCKALHNLPAPPGNLVFQQRQLWAAHCNWLL